jgi:DNA-binding beta-propeller fold protein YncE
MLPIKKLYIDSRDRTPDSLSASNFRINLPYVVQTPDNTVFFITDVSIPHVWTTIESGINDKLYVWITKTVSPFDNTYYVVNMTPGNYTAATLASTLQASLNLIVPDNNNNLFTVTNTAGTNNLNIAINIANRSVVLVSDAYFGSVPALANLVWVKWLGGSR